MISIRPAAPGELVLLPGIEHAAGQLFRTVGMAAVAQGQVTPAERWRPLCEAETLWVAVTDGGGVIGFVACEAIEGLLFVHELAVAPAFQRNGVGRALMRTVIQAAMELRLGGVALRTFRDVAWNGPFYRKLGFVEGEAPELSRILGGLRAGEQAARLDPARRCTMVRRTTQALRAEPLQAEATRLAHAGDGVETRLSAAARTVNPAIQRASTVLLPDAASLYAHDRPTYGRQGLGVQAALAQAIGELEGGGVSEAAAVTLYSSGTAAISGALMAVLSPGDELLMTGGAYQPTQRFCDNILKRFGIVTRYFAPRASAGEIAAMIGPATRAIFLESPSSLTFELQDVAAIAAVARAAGVVSLIDNTWGAGVLFKPLAAGVDIAIQALTKYASGGSDVFMGSAATADARLARRLHDTVRDAGWAVSPDDAYTVLRSLRSLPLRLARHGAAAIEVAGWLQTQPEVAEVLCPALPASPDHDLWRRDFSGMNGLFGVVLRSAPVEAVNAFLDRLELFGLGFSWGGFESLAIPSDPQIDGARRPWAGVGPLLRLHVGLEAAEDLIADLRQGLDAFAAVCEGRA